jgi:hypothetical protein
MASTTTKFVALTTQTENELKVNDKVRGTLHRQGRRTYQFTQRTQREVLPEELCKDLARTKHGQIYANGYGVSVHLYVRHDKYNSPRELSGIILSEVKELCKQLLQVAAVELLNQVKQVWA